MLKVLPPKISNLIAAGEVVQRPASVVKELIENAVDAGAANITVIIEDSGKTLIQIIDDGCGMSPEDAKLCFQRHATSKIATAEDLNGILTYGFRGEALPSIASVAEVTLRTRQRGAQTGSETVLSPDGIIYQEETAMSEGTNIAVRNIFYTVPARRKFLKSDNAEFRHILAEFSKVALSRYDVGLRLIHNGKDIYHLKKANTLKQRILEIEGKDMAKELVDLHISNPIVEISGFVGSPEDVRKSAGNQFFFVNGRYFRSPYLHKAVIKAYDKLIPEGSYPSYYLYIHIAPEDVDVNIHPAKTEVKFENETEIFEFLTAAVRESIGKHSFIPTIDFEHDSIPDFPTQMSFPKNDRQILSGISSYPRTSFGIDSTRSENSSANYKSPQRFGSGHIPGIEHLTENSFTDTVSHKSSGFSAPVDGYNTLFEDSGLPGPAIIRIGTRYIATSLRSGLMIVDIRRAKERIFYERYLREMDDAVPISHQVLFPCQIDLSLEKYSILMEDEQRLKILGFNILPAGDTSVCVQGLPEGFSTNEEDVRAAIDSLISTFMEETSHDFIKASERDKMAKKMALSAASCQLDQFTNTEARLLVDSLFACMEPEISPSGHKCMFVLTEEELEKRL